jgi:hypothetical protein
MLTTTMGVTLPGDYCFYCHEDIGDERPTHVGLDHDSCQNAGCHNFHDNRGLHEDFLEQHLGEPSLFSNRRLPRRRHAQAPRVLGAGAADAPPDARQAEIVAAWSTSAHARGDVNCSGCHQRQDSADFKNQIGDAVCGECHAAQVAGFRAGHHGMRQAVGLSPMRPGIARIPMKDEAATRELGCNSCHSAHAFDLREAAVDSCLACHDDEHSRAYPGSPHARSFEAELRGGPAGSGVSCARCHMPTVPVRPGAPELVIEHNQNDNLRPNEKMLRSVCAHCHGVGFSLDALGDQRLIRNNFRGTPARHVESVDWIAKRRQERAPSEAAND